LGGFSNGVGAVECGVGATELVVVPVGNGYVDRMDGDVGVIGGGAGGCW
jgi:hypothetical protein